MTAGTRTLAGIWGELSTDERLSILLEQQSAEVQRLSEIAESLEPCARGRIAGYATALADITYYVIEGNPPPTEEDLQ